MPRIYCARALATEPGQNAVFLLPPAAARHVQVLRLQPGSALTLFNGQGGEFDAVITQMGRSDVQVQLGAHHATEREAARAVHLAIGIPTNERMDWLIEKATELGAASVQPLLTERSVLRLHGERAQKRQAHWQAIAVAACEQCGRNRVPLIHPLLALADWLTQEAAATAHARPAAPLASSTGSRWLLSLHGPARALHSALQGPASLTVLSGPEGGLSAAEEAAACAAGFAPLGLGARVLRAETAPLALLAALSLHG